MGVGQPYSYPIQYSGSLFEVIFMKQSVRVWDFPTRFFHWSLVIGIALMFYTAKYGHMKWHLNIGLFLFGLMFFRFFWGILGSQTARFSNFIKGPKSIKRYILGKMPEHEQPGHNPLGALMVLALLGLVSLQVITGLFSPDNNTFIYDGFLNHLVPSTIGNQAIKLHRLIPTILLGFISIHVFVVFLYLIFKRNNLITPMFTGYKKIDGTTPELKFAPKGAASILAILIIAIIYFILQL